MKKRKFYIIFISFLIICSSSIAYADVTGIDNFEIFKEHGSIILLVDAETGEIVFANEAAQNFYKYSESQIESMFIQEINTLSAEEVEIERMAVVNEERNHFIHNHQLANGEIKIVEVHSDLFLHDNHRLLFSIIHDITAETMFIEKKAIVISIIIAILMLLCIKLFITVKKYKKEKQRAIENENRTHAIIANIQGVVYRCKNDDQWTMEYLSEGCFKLTGYKPEELINNSMLSFSNLVLDEYRKSMLSQNNPVYEHEYLITTKNGEEKWVIDRGQMIFSEDGQVIAQEGILTDITSVKSIEKEKKWLEEGTILSKVGKWEKDLINNTVKWSASMYQIFDSEIKSEDIPDDFLSEDIPYDFLKAYFHPDDVDHINTVVDNALKSGETYELEYRVLFKDGSIKWLYQKGYALYNENGEPYKLIGTTQDITETKKIQECLNRELERSHALQQEAEEANAAKSEFLSNMSHEIRTPLNAIVGFTDLTLRTSLTSQQDNYLRKVKASANTLLQLISDILDVSKFEADAIELESTPFELEELLQKVVNQATVTSHKKGWNLYLTWIKMYLLAS